MYEKILVPLDGSKSAEAVLEHVQQLAQCTGSEIILLHVVAYPHYDYLLTEPELSTSLRDSMENEGCKYMERLANDLVSHYFKVRAAEVWTGRGLRFTVWLDRAMDIGPAEFAGKPLAWLLPAKKSTIIWNWAPRNPDRLIKNK